MTEELLKMRAADVGVDRCLPEAGVLTLAAIAGSCAPSLSPELSHGLDPRRSREAA